MFKMGKGQAILYPIRKSPNEREHNKNTQRTEDPTRQKSENLKLTENPHLGQDHKDEQKGAEMKDLPKGVTLKELKTANNECL